MSPAVHGFSSEANPNLQLSIYSRRALFEHLKTISTLADLAMAIEGIYDLAFSSNSTDSSLIPYVEVRNFNTKYSVIIGDDVLLIELSASDNGNKVSFTLRDVVNGEHQTIDTVELPNLIGRGHIKLVNALHIIADWHLRPKKH